MKLLNRQGFTLFEIFLTLLILAIAITPMVNAFAPALLSSGQEEEQAVLTGHVRQTMNGLLNLDFATLDANKASPDVLVNMLGDQVATGTIVSVTDVSGTDAQEDPIGGLLELKVTLKNVTLQTLKAAR
jgi:Tfp pilus assembly protein PilV